MSLSGGRPKAYFCLKATTLPEIRRKKAKVSFYFSVY
jgi:hypothetical protein